jgi:hypothetical protein
MPGEDWTGRQSILTLEASRRRAAAFFCTEEEKSECVGVMQQSSNGDCSGPGPLLLKAASGCEKDLVDSKDLSALPALPGCPSDRCPEYCQTGVPLDCWPSFSGAIITGDATVGGREDIGEPMP